MGKQDRFKRRKERLKLLQAAPDMPATVDGVGTSRQGSMQIEHEGVEVLSEGGSGGESTERGLEHLDSDMLTVVFSYLPQIELFEDMCVCRAWGKIVMEASVLWKEVKVCKMWALGGSGKKSVPPSPHT